MEHPKNDVRKKWDFFVLTECTCLEMCGKMFFFQIENLYRYIIALIHVIILSLQLEDDNMAAHFEEPRFRQYLGTQPGYQGWEGTEKSDLMEWWRCHISWSGWMVLFGYFLVSSPKVLLTWVDDPIWGAYFSDGLNSPTKWCFTLDF